jgi:hypothetical protein
MKTGRSGGTVDAEDLKSFGPQGPCRFDSCLRHEIVTCMCVLGSINALQL